jgi:para-nitrobenzyl esterase
MKAVRSLIRAGVAGLCVTLALPGVPALAQGAPSAQTAQGRVAGTWDGGVRVFKGIAYASPPVGERRWRPPAPPAAWRGVRAADRFGPDCMQASYPADSVYFEHPRSTSEDCLTLNIWTPAKPARNAPVIVWIHGGSLQFGGSAGPIYDGREYAKRGVVFVSINYRLGVLGWLAYPELSAESADGVSGNYGLLDQVAALQWVRRNIAAFGGDPANVTAMGESAGALSVTYLLGSPRARGLFGKAIVQSTNMRAVPRLREAAFGLPPAEATGRAVAESLGARDLAALRGIDAAALVAAGQRARFTAQPVVDGVVVPDQIVTLFDRGEQMKIPVLAGVNSGEVRSQRRLVPAVPDDAAGYEAAIAKLYGDMALAFLRLYPASDPAKSMIAAMRDTVYGWAGERLVRGQAAAGQPAYFYVFDHCYAAARVRDLCAFHASELPFTFGTAGTQPVTPPNWPAAEGPAEQRLAAQMIDYWTSFAARAKPVAAGGPDWRPYGETETFMRFADRPRLEQDPLPGSFEFHERRMQRRRAEGVQWFLP